MVSIAKHQVVESEGFSLEHGWRELTLGAFAVWTRLMIEPRRSFVIGTKPLAERLKIDYRVLRGYLRELRNKGYIRLIKGSRHQPTQIVILRRAMLVGGTQFITL